MNGRREKRRKRRKGEKPVRSCRSLPVDYRIPEHPPNTPVLGCFRGAKVRLLGGGVSGAT